VRRLIVVLCVVTIAALSPVGPAPTRAAPAAAECAHAWDPLFAAAVARGRREMPCPSTAPFAVAAAIQPFERGAMLWLADNPVVFRIEAEVIGGPRIVVIRNDSFRLFPDRFEEGQPEQLGLVPPAPGLLEPRRGFGKVWREQQAAGVTETVKTVPDEIGWATEPERGFTALMQGFHGQSWAMQLGEGVGVFDKMLHNYGLWEYVGP
jgi:hypothetical protein